jgi:DNA topoisomerase-1
MEYPIILRDIDPALEKKLNLYFIGSDKEEVKTKEESIEIGFKDEESAKELIKVLKKEYEIYQIDKPRIINTNPSVPFKTSSMQQAAINVLGMNIGKATSVAQKLYEGININGKHTALISYPRTDSIRLADMFVTKVKKYITSTYGEKEFIQREFVSKADTGKNVQDAHEGIRVIDPFIFPSDLKDKIPSDEYKLYKLI